MSARRSTICSLWKDSDGTYGGGPTGTPRPRVILLREEDCTTLVLGSVCLCTSPLSSCSMDRPNGGPKTLNSYTTRPVSAVIYEHGHHELRTLMNDPSLKYPQSPTEPEPVCAAGRQSAFPFVARARRYSNAAAGGGIWTMVTVGTQETRAPAEEGRAGFPSSCPERKGALSRARRCDGSAGLYQPFCFARATRA